MSEDLTEEKTNYVDFIGEVQHRIEAGRQAEAVRATRAVLNTIGERVDEGGATDIASPLPMEIDRYLLEVDHGHQYDFDEFVQRVHERMNYEDLDLDTSYGQPSGVDESDTVFRIKAITALLSETVPGGQIANVEEQFPEDYEEMFELVGVETTPWEQRQT
ncbi:DUF2267 domain-containing protein [Natronolimnohabitans innermongolicus]|uniref:DUF2267 domain-containing protein n=1 Tax=Natronolimnohabitans innermongolicus JCM 12255 TaxID=1227499 RepID=L9XEA2_9EURY|nr:DUF2267 domain-containing protein [Natronolimnohabitans innermongolicus]ELY58963.1 hypothetical protein C493_05940 [Natronolimnohabitans innermongolicus JCM 12255]